MQDQTKPYRVGVFRTVDQADRALQDLRAEGFADDELSVVCSNETKERHFADVQTPVPSRDYPAQAIGVGAVAGAAVGGLALAALTVATGGLAAPAIAGGAIMAGGAAGGAFTGAMSVRLFEGELGAYYDQMVRSGWVLVAAEPKGDEPHKLDVAERVLQHAGAQSVPLTTG